MRYTSEADSLFTIQSAIAGLRRCCIVDSGGAVFAVINKSGEKDIKVRALGAGGETAETVARSLLPATL
jgi:hypothetical protein